MTTTIDQNPPTVAETDEFDFASLDPANLMKQAIGEQVEIPSRGEEAPPSDGPPPDPLVAALAPTPTQPTSTQTPDGKPEGVNMRKLRELREAADRKAAELEEQNKALAAQLAELEPRARGYESEKERLERELQEKEEALRHVQATAGRAAARERGDWKEKADDIRRAAQSVQQILEMPELKEAGLNHSVATLFDPASRQALNEVIRALNDNGRFAEAQEVIDSHRAVNAWRGELRKIEDNAAAEAEAWQTRREESALGVVRTVREQLAAANPVHDTKSPEFLAMPPEQREFLTAQHAAAEKAAREMLGRVNRPQELIAETYKNQLGLRLFQQANAGLTGQLAATQKELAEVKARLESYEKAAGGGAGVGGGGGQRVSDPDDPAELARMLDPRNLQGYRGV